MIDILTKVPEVYLQAALYREASTVVAQDALLVVAKGTVTITKLTNEINFIRGETLPSLDYWKTNYQRPHCCHLCSSRIKSTQILLKIAHLILF